LKSAYYRRYEKQLGKERPTETVIIDGVDTQLLTVLRYTDYKARDISDTWLTKDGLTQVRD
ncbi:MAG TPA: outer membrane lipoprotein-sorting protein, partial [Burkholderiales bacterium]|nr:outer membrane lipoprotein-sorting protein [Burkholderiales bacterium]